MPLKPRKSRKQLAPVNNAQALGKINARRGEEHDDVLMEISSVSHDALDKSQAWSGEVYSHWTSRKAW